MRHLEEITRKEPINDNSKVYSKKDVTYGSVATSLTGIVIMGVASYEKDTSFLYAGLGMFFGGIYSLGFINASVSNNQDAYHTNGETSPNSVDREA